jgi:hypothetical protein
MVYGWVVLRLYLWPCRRDTSFRIYPTLGSHNPWSRDGRNCQLRNKEYVMHSFVEIDILTIV